MFYFALSCFPHPQIANKKSQWEKHTGVQNPTISETQLRPTSLRNFPDCLGLGSASVHFLHRLHGSLLCDIWASSWTERYAQPDGGPCRGGAAHRWLVTSAFQSFGTGLLTSASFCSHLVWKPLIKDFDQTQPRMITAYCL